MDIGMILALVGRVTFTETLVTDLGRAEYHAQLFDLLWEAAETRYAQC